jgi:nicotinic acid mononucleotide adenylyltransferase
VCASDAIELWTSLDADGPPRVVWPRTARASRITVLMGAFDPPTNAHLDLVRAAATLDGSAPVLCMTKVLLARPPDELLTREQRVGILRAIALRVDAGLAFANRGTYLDVGRVLRAGGIDARFVVGADKLAQLTDPSFYADGVEGVRATFEELRFVIVPRGGIDLAGLPTGDIRILEPSDAFGDQATADISGTAVRRLHRAGAPVRGLVPPEVDLALRGYTSAR